MSPDRVEVVLDPIDSLFPKIFNIRPGASVDQLLLVRRKRRFGHGIVVTDAGLAEGSEYVIFLAVLSEILRRVLRSPVGVEDYLVGGFSIGKGHVQGVGDEAGSHMIVDRVTDDLP